MTLPAFDRDGYPTDETLAALEQWPITAAGTALDFLAAAWSYPNAVQRDISAGEAAVVHADTDDEFLRVATGGWSGNESLINAFSHSHAWFVTWCLSAKGGLYIFRYPPTVKQP